MTASEVSAQGLLAVARVAARAGAAQLAVRPRTVNPLSVADLGAETKSSDSDWVTDFDRKAEEAVRSSLQAYRPQDEISGEEYGTTTVEDPSGIRWSIDPLDGTTNFIRGVPHYATSVAAGRDLEDGTTEWLAAAIVAPALGRTWYAAKGQGAFSVVEPPAVPEDVGLRSRPAEPVKLTGPVVGRSGRLLASGFGYDADRRRFQLDQLRDLLRAGDFGDLRRIGSAALDLCMVADGTLDAYAEYGCQEYDWAAGALIAEEAGVQVRRPRWAESTDTPDWIIAGDVGMTHADLPLHEGHPGA